MRVRITPAFKCSSFHTLSAFTFTNCQVTPSGEMVEIPNHITFFIFLFFLFSVIVEPEQMQKLINATHSRTKIVQELTPVVCRLQKTVVHLPQTVLIFIFLFCSMHLSLSVVFLFPPLHHLALSPPPTPSLSSLPALEKEYNARIRGISESMTSQQSDRHRSYSFSGLSTFPSLLFFPNTFYYNFSTLISFLSFF